MKTRIGGVKRACLGEVAFATKPRLAMTMLERALATGLTPRWVLADEVYGSDSQLRRFLEPKGQPYVLAVTSQQRRWVDLRQLRARTGQD